MPEDNRKWIVIIVIVLLIGVGVAGFMFFRGSSKGTASLSPSPSLFVEEPTVTPEQTVNKADIKIKILNGSGVVGEAGKVQKILEGADFTVESTGNADNYDYKTTEIQAKETVSSTITDELTELLQADYTVSTSLLDSEETEDIIIIVGSRKNAPTPTVKPTAGATSPTAKPTAGVTTTATPTPSITITP
ncbi:hypothetical protein A3D80_02295 [Candidatus Roizmanbacteria bacterium RIFCSPHIGHO2_02_FULL_40_13b]|uniref:LytR/CpsA/Psr regulator C-terminal domain-containing protein n=1 Tax=Candidatus Roizmanbacteria bacterium RIFCSPHIGHO2_01_FULL_39_24 TaxID=1802032 RepID=A0A1F7GKK8_9BACT|nr:MAG: hypothetical protein A2799_00010 [Candidatus Roizmanbacteria bacterium RIFCSPHIGHO2_01_FULL_39_24]OGK26660.1 MAG: hypothetical protein A3D80_02295 [Candidatus Roizmanbacteria bacterium RIFCSPHIGHO2_02_FULL_40_13b]OGK50108.1 MAG: hypothetical protein A3A56_04080 [Candidatus Roizmanbacteria bacterium RIFCSPLOWO2_01_FULL_40_32]OGK55911.1 MAG: hypothetical protein A3H83_02315 [Candidatus Roizmanbacteria bacterium RIFCSPLOWO2_02_FULL_39_8]